MKQDYDRQGRPYWTLKDSQGRSCCSIVFGVDAAIYRRAHPEREWPARVAARCVPVNLELGPRDIDEKLLRRWKPWIKNIYEPKQGPPIPIFWNPETGKWHLLIRDPGTGLFKPTPQPMATQPPNYSSDQMAPFGLLDKTGDVFARVFFPPKKRQTR
jgi:hypothetical protein